MVQFGKVPDDLVAPSVSEAPLRTHIVRDGDTLTALAERYLDDPAREWEIFQENGDQLSSPELLPIGAILKIPPREPAIVSETERSTVDPFQQAPEPVSQPVASTFQQISTSQALAYAGPPLSNTEVTSEPATQPFLTQPTGQPDLVPVAPVTPSLGAPRVQLLTPIVAD